MIRFAGYDVRIYDRHRKEIRTVIIYSSDVKKRPSGLKIGSLTYEPDIIMLYDYDGETIYAGLEAKLKSGQELTDVDMLNLMFLPLMKNKLPKSELAKKSIEMAKTITDRTKRDACIASAVAFMSRYLNDNEINDILEVLKMTDIVSRIITDDRTEIAKKAIKEGATIEFICKITGLDIDTVEELKEQYEEEQENAE
jgi:hypothetical protein